MKRETLHLGSVMRRLFITPASTGDQLTEERWQVCFSVGACGVAGVVDLASGRVAHVHHPPQAGPGTNPASSHTLSACRQRIGWMRLWGRESCVVCVSGTGDAELLTLRQLRGGRGGGLAWGGTTSLEATRVRSVELRQCLRFRRRD